MSKWILTTMPASVPQYALRKTGCSRAPADPPRPRDRVMPAPRSCRRSRRRKNCRRSQTRPAGSVARNRPRSPIWRGIVKTRKSQYDMKGNLAADKATTCRCMNVFTYCCACCCAAVHCGCLGGWVVGWGAVRAAAAVVLLVGSTACLLYTSPSPRDQRGSRMPSSA